MHENNTTFSNLISIKSTSEQLIMSTVHGVTALEGNNILIIGQFGTNLGRSRTNKVTNRKVQSSNLTTHVILTTLGGNHEGTRMFELTGSIAVLALLHLVGSVLIGEFDDGNVTVSILNKSNVSRSKILIIGVKHDGKTEDESIGKFHVIHDTFVGGFVHESSQWRESTVHDKFYITELTRTGLNSLRALGNGSILLFIRFQNQIHESSSVRNLLGCHL
mmetsp:Transcript_21849/g.28153  ORF Transcript_21849/g.28153 Transcript_21849/m.28153 type:complete len:219 (+) Transcript_21849:590-1246(+)